MEHLRRETIDGRKALCAYLDDNFNPTVPDKASLVKATFEDGGEVAFFTPSPQPEHPVARTR